MSVLHAQQELSQVVDSKQLVKLVLQEHILYQLLQLVILVLLVIIQQLVQLPVLHVQLEPMLLKKKLFNVRNAQ